MYLVVFGEGATGAAAAAEALSQGLTADAIWGAITPFIPVVIVVTLASLGVYFMRRITKKASKGKGGM